MKINTVKLWQTIFIFNVATVIFCSIVGTLSFFYFPKIPIAVTFGANVWAAFMCGGLTKDLLWGIIIGYSWYQGFKKEGVVINWKFWKWHI